MRYPTTAVALVVMSTAVQACAPGSEEPAATRGADGTVDGNTVYPPPGDPAEIDEVGVAPLIDPCAGVTCSGLGTCEVDAGEAICACEADFEAQGLACVSTRDVQLYVSLVSHRGTYFTAEDNGGSSLHANRNAIGPWEKFVLSAPRRPGCDTVMDGDPVTLRTSSGHLFSAKRNGDLRVDAIQPQAWEHFTLINHSQPGACLEEDDEFSLKSAHGRYVGVDKQGPVRANSSEIGAWEHISLVMQPNPYFDEHGRPTPVIPYPSGVCPQLATGSVDVMERPVQLWVGDRRQDVKGPILLFWHGTGGSPDDVIGSLGQDVIDEVVAAGGVVASFTGRPMALHLLLWPGNTANTVWFKEDFDRADHIVACAAQQLNIDARRIYSAGDSAGGLQTGAMVLARSSYLASAYTNSGGIVEALQVIGTAAVDWTHPGSIPAVISTHGGPQDWVAVDFRITTSNMHKRVRSRDGFAVNCDHGGGHVAAPPDVKRFQWEFLKAHPFGTRASPYAGALPSSAPAICKVWQ